MGTHPIFESDFDCLTEWVVVDLDHVKKNLERNRKKVDREVASVNEAEIVKTDLDLEIGTEKTVIAIAIVAVAAVIESEMIKEVHHRQRVLERIQFVGLKSLQSQDSRHIEKRRWAKL